jgi:hypothetical protein
MRCPTVSDKFDDEDTSVGDSQNIHGMSINGGKIEQKAAPDLMRPSDYEQLYNSAVDVTSLPGGWAPKYKMDDVIEESQRQADQTAMIVAQTARHRHGGTTFDTMFQHKSQHSLGKLSTRDEVFDFVSDLASSKKPAFQMMHNLLYSCLDKRHYSPKYISQYQKHGLLPLLVRRMYASFFNLLAAVCQLAHDFPIWENGGPDENMLRYHAKRIFHICNYSVLKKQLVLQIYTYLRDAEHQDFEPTGMDKALWKANLQATNNVRDMVHSVLGEEGIGIADMNGSGKDGKNGGGLGTTCAHCKSKELHRLYSIPGQKTYCPLKKIDRLKAHKEAKNIITEKQEHPEREITSLVAAVLAKP